MINGDKYRIKELLSAQVWDFWLIWCCYVSRMTYSLPDPTLITRLSKEEQVELLNNLFEPHPAIHSYLTPYLFTDKNTFTSYDQFTALARSKLLELDPNASITQEIISAHPRLGIPAALSSHSDSEQKTIFGSDKKVDDIVSQFIALNKSYEDNFPGLRYVLFVNGRSKDEIFKDFERRLSRKNYKLEVEEALNAVCDIANDRVRKLQLEVPSL